MTARIRDETTREPYRIAGLPRRDRESWRSVAARGRPPSTTDYLSSSRRATLARLRRSFDDHVANVTGSSGCHDPDDEAPAPQTCFGGASPPATARSPSMIRRRRRRSGRSTGSLGRRRRSASWWRLGAAARSRESRAWPSTLRSGGAAALLPSRSICPLHPPPARPATLALLLAHQRMGADQAHKTRWRRFRVGARCSSSSRLRRLRLLAGSRRNSDRAPTRDRVDTARLSLAASPASRPQEVPRRQITMRALHARFSCVGVCRRTMPALRLLQGRRSSASISGTVALASAGATSSAIEPRFGREIDSVPIEEVALGRIRDAAKSTNTTYSSTERPSVEFSDASAHSARLSRSARSCEVVDISCR